LNRVIQPTGMDFLIETGYATFIFLDDDKRQKMEKFDGISQWLISL
jgi:hypothetical protein